MWESLKQVIYSPSNKIQLKISDFLISTKSQIPTHLSEEVDTEQGEEDDWKIENLFTSKFSWVCQQTKKSHK